MRDANLTSLTPFAATTTGASKPGLVETAQYVLPLAEWPHPMIHADLPLRPFVVDSQRRTHWAGAAPVLRMLMNKGWQPPPDTPPKLLEPIAGPIDVTPVEPRWKVWKPKGLRKRRTYYAQVKERPPFAETLGV